MMRAKAGYCSCGARQRSWEVESCFPGAKTRSSRRDRFVVAHAGQVEPGFEPVEEAFAEVVGTQPGTGAATAVWLDGRWLVDLWGGTADAAAARAWARDSIVQPYSVAKPFVAVCALLLTERGQLELDGAVQRYWPEFTAPATGTRVVSSPGGCGGLG